MLDKLVGKWAPKVAPGPHKSRESLPLIVLLRNRLKYALTKREVTLITMQRLIKVDGKVRTEPNYPAGFMGTIPRCDRGVTAVALTCWLDVVSIEKTNETFRLLYDTKGRFAVHPVGAEEAKVRSICPLLTS